MHSTSIFILGRRDNKQRPDWLYVNTGVHDTKRVIGGAVREKDAAAAAAAAGISL